MDGQTDRQTELQWLGRAESSSLQKLLSHVKTEHATCITVYTIEQI